MFARTVGITKNHMDLALPVIPKLPQNIVPRTHNCKWNITIQQEKW